MTTVTASILTEWKKRMRAKLADERRRNEEQVRQARADKAKREKSA